ncbi:histidine phosphatase family protein [Nocardioides sp.]|uniref:histidine phosphatase family protein n=1 Tax=Nocardioides sp. TaxID=35761 RepID=UPI0031FE5513|nr:Phosphoglycerate mutase [Nocardioides sp.]
MTAGAPGRRLVLLRHGQTAWNLELRVQGHHDVEIDDTGHRQAAAAAPLIAAYQPVALWCSDLTRARQTAAYVAKETGLEPTYDERLREYYLGERQGLTHAEYDALAPEEFETFRRGSYDVAPGAESTEQVRARMVEVLTELLASIGPGETAVAVSHGAAGKVGLAALLGWPDSVSDSLRGLGNCGWLVLEEPFSDAPLRLSAYNRKA